MNKLLLVIVTLGMSVSCGSPAREAPVAKDDPAAPTALTPGLSDEGLARAAACPTCTGCNNQDPSYNSCSASASTAFNTAYPIRWGVETWGTVELRYSSRCGTNWSRVHSNVPGQYQMEAWVEQGSSRYGYALYRGTTLDSWSTMRYGCGILTRACACITRVERGTACNCTPAG
jgi:hypothetical protein